MKIRDLFVKPIDRSIEGVIKADANEHILQEVEEYVLTEDIARKVETFLDEYNDYQTGNGSWISGFFGSGKSHLLKMLSLLLENQKINGKEMVEYFKPKTSDNLLKGLMDKAAKTPSKSILFNIDQKATITHKKQTDAVLSVFVKVFNEMQGYYGGIDYVAKLESDLHKRGQLETFKQAIQDITGKPWTFIREESLLEEDSIDQAYAIASGKDPETIHGILDKYKDSYKMSIEDFANNVNDYINEQGKQFRLNFFVDEVGQFIADNVKLMTNLQTIAESLNTKCKGRSWILVTAQEDMDTVVGEQTKEQANDFSKIQARFHNRIKLNSKDVAEVIQKRLLDKTSEAKHSLKQLYQRECENLGTLFRFSENSRNYRDYDNEKHFVDCYPFVPYQFELFQSAIESLSNHNAFEGKYSSVGERSMLGVFQKVGEHLQNQDEGTLATFDCMFEGIRSTLKSNTQRDVLSAENNLSKNPFAIKVLKALFLVKYCKEFKPTLSNIQVLLIPSFCTDMQKLRVDTQQALDLLVQQTYIQRNGELYEYLTDKEKDIEKEIKNMEINTEEQFRFLQELSLEHVASNRITHKEFNQDFGYTLKIDGSIRGRGNEEVSIHFVTPLYQEYENKTVLLMPGNSEKELLLYLPVNKHWIEDVSQYLRTRKFVQSFTQKEESLKHIIDKQSEANTKRRSELQSTFQEMVRTSEIYVQGLQQDISHKNAKERIKDAFYKLIESIYRNRKWLGNKQYSEEDIRKALLEENTLLATLSQPVQEVLNYVHIQSGKATKLTVKQIKTHFANPPYGWEQYAVLTFLAKLWSSHKIEFLQDHMLQEDSKHLYTLLRNSRQLDSITVRAQKEYTASQVRSLKEFYKDFTSHPAPEIDAKALAKATKEALEDALQVYREMEQQIHNYPFCESFSTAVHDIQLSTKEELDWFLTKLPQKSETLLLEKEEVLDPIKAFLKGSQKTIFNQIQSFLQKENDNLSAYLNKPQEVQELQTVLRNPECYKNNCLNQAKNTFAKLQNELDTIKETQKQASVKELETLKQQVPDTVKTSPAFRTALQQAQNRIQNSGSIASWHDATRKLEEDIKQLLQPPNTTAPKPNQEPEQDPPKEHTGGGVVNDIVQASDLFLTYNKNTVSTQQEADEYIQSLKDSLQKELKKGKTILLKGKTQ